MVERLSSMCKVLGSISSTSKDNDVIGYFHCQLGSGLESREKRVGRGPLRSDWSVGESVGAGGPGGRVSGHKRTRLTMGSTILYTGPPGLHVYKGDLE